MSLPLLLAAVAVFVSGAAYVGGDSKSQQYAQAVISKYSPGEFLDLKQFQTFFSRFMTENTPGDEDSGYGQWCRTMVNSTNNSTCIECSSSADLFHHYAVDDKINATSLLNALPALLMAVEEEYCKTRVTNNTDDGDEIHMPRKPTTAETWGYGLGVVFMVIGLSNLGGCMTPLMKSPSFQKLLMFLVAVAIGTQAGAGIVVLIPESMHLMHIEKTKADYLWKCVCVLGGIIFVIVLERMLKLAFHARKTMKERTVAEITIEAGSTVTMTTIDSENEKSSHLKNEDNQLAISNGTNAKAVVPAGNGVVSEKSDEKTEGTVDSTGKVKRQIATVAWMVMLGDAIHKFVDGLSVGAAFTENITTGLTLAISVLCEEFAHELGDISILLHSGMTMKQAMFWNTMSAAMGIPGLIIGIFVGETTSANQWIFAIAAGIFIYVPLADMLPEMAHTIDKALKDDTGALFLFFLQLLGLCIGFGIIVLVAAYSGDIEL